MSTLHPRTPKLLAPLDRRPRDGAALPVLKHHVPLKPISQSPLSSRTRLRRERLSWGSPRTGPLVTKGGSEESGSSSSSQSSMDLQDEDGDEEDERDTRERTSENGNPKLARGRLLQHSRDVRFTESDLVRETKLHFRVQSKIGHIPPIHRSAQNVDGNSNSHASDLLCTVKILNFHHEVKATNMNYTKEPDDNHSIINSTYAKQDDTMNHIKDSVNNNVPFTLWPKEQNHHLGCTTEPDTEIIHPITCNIKDELHHVKQAEEAKKDFCYKVPQLHKQILDNAEDTKLKTSTAEGKTHQRTSAVHVDPNRGEKMVKTLKPAQNKERRNSMNCELRANIQTNQSFNVLAHKDRSIISQNKSKSNLKCSSLSTQIKDKKKVKGAHYNMGTPLPRKKVIYHPQNKRTNPEKLNSNRAQQHTPVRELNSAWHLKKVTIAGTLRSKSAVDFIAYKDMFQQIQSGDEGPAIYEMFAGPIYENLRVSSTCEKTDRQVQSSLSGKTRQSHKVKHRHLKQPQCKLRRSPGETVVVPAKNKAKLVSKRAKSQLTPVPRKCTHKNNNMPKPEAELVLSKHDELCHNNPQEKTEDHVLSTIEEALSKYGCETLKSDDKTQTTPITYSHMHINMQEKNRNSSTENLNGAVPEPVLHQNQMKINTWTSSSSSSSNTIMSPVYQKFLDEVGDGPLTDDLLQCLAEELISLDERDVTVGPCSDNLESSKKKSNREGSGQDVVSEVNQIKLYLKIKRLSTS